MFTASMLVCALVFGQVSSTPFCPCGENCSCTASNNCGCVSQPQVCGPNGCNTFPQQNYSACANANTCGPNGCSNAQVNNRFYNYPRYRTRTYRRFRIFRRW